MKLMSLKFAAKCRCCGKTVEAGHEAYFDKDSQPGKKVVCLPCFADGERPQADEKEPEVAKTPAVPQKPASANQAFSPISDDEISYDPKRSDFRVFDSIEEYVALRPSEANDDSFENTIVRPRDSDGERWFGVAGPLVEPTLRNGWADGVARLAELDDPELDELCAVSTRRKIHRGDCGDDLDIHRVYSGGLDTAWTSRRRAHRPAMPTLTLIPIIGCRSSISAEELFWRGAAVAKLSDILQSAGYGVEIIATLACIGLTKSMDERSVCAHVIPLKEANMPLDLSSIATAICFPGFWRWAGFRAMSSFDRRISSTFGSFPSDRQQRRIAEFAVRRSLGSKNAIFARPDIYTREAAIGWIRQTIEKINSGEFLSA